MAGSVPARAPAKPRTIGNTFDQQALATVYAWAYHKSAMSSGPSREIDAGSAVHSFVEFLNSEVPS
jgi:hypothetical protein